MRRPLPKGFHVWQGSRQWYWHCKRRGRIVADGGEAYATESNARRAVFAHVRYCKSL